MESVRSESGPEDSFESVPETGKTLEERVQRAFEGATDEQVDKYLDQLLTNWREAEGFNRKNMILAVILFVLFELSTRDAISEVSLASVKIDAVSALKFALPVVVAYLHLSNIIHVTRIELLNDLYVMIYRCKRPQRFRQDMEIPVKPIGLFEQVHVFSEKSDAPNLAGVIAAVRALLAYFALPLLVLYMAVRLFVVSPLGHVGLWVSLVLSLALALAALIYLYFTSVLRTPHMRTP